MQSCLCKQGANTRTLVCTAQAVNGLHFKAKLLAQQEHQFITHSCNNTFCYQYTSVYSHSSPVAILLGGLVGFLARYCCCCSSWLWRTELDFTAALHFHLYMQVLSCSASHCVGNNRASSRRQLCYMQQWRRRISVIVFLLFINICYCNLCMHVFALIISDFEMCAHILVCKCLTCREEEEILQCLCFSYMYIPLALIVMADINF